MIVPVCYFLMTNEYNSWPLAILFCEYLFKSFTNFCTELSPFGFFCWVPYRPLTWIFNYIFCNCLFSLCALPFYSLNDVFDVKFLILMNSIHYGLLLTFLEILCTSRLSPVFSSKGFLSHLNIWSDENYFFCIMIERYQVPTKV